METVLKSLTQHAPEILLFLSVVAIGLLITVVRLSMQVRKQRSMWRSLLEGARGDTLEKLLYQHLRERMELQEQFHSLSSRVQSLETQMQSAKRYVGVVKYDAFEDVAGKQSFAMAIYDDRGNGAVVSSLIGRTDGRVYCKPIYSGRSERDLSQEELRAIEAARTEAPQSIVSP